MHFGFKDVVKRSLRSLVHIVQLVVNAMVHYVIVADFHVGLVVVIATKLANVHHVFHSVNLWHHRIINQVNMPNILVENIQFTRGSLRFAIRV